MSKRAKARHAVVVSALSLLTAGNAIAQTAIWNNPEGGSIFESTNWTFLDDQGPYILPRYWIFDLESDYTVGVKSYTGGDRLLIERGNIEFRREPDDFSVQLLQFSETKPLNPPSFVIGTTSSDALLTTDFSIDTYESFIGMSPNASLTMLHHRV